MKTNWFKSIAAAALAAFTFTFAPSAWAAVTTYYGSWITNENGADAKEGLPVYVMSAATLSPADAEAALAAGEFDTTLAFASTGTYYEEDFGSTFYDEMSVPKGTWTFYVVVIDGTKYVISKSVTLNVSLRGSCPDIDFGDFSDEDGTSLYTWREIGAGGGSAGGGTPTEEPVEEPEEPVTPAAETECVQLWKDGPYFATKNVGAENPEDYGYYFWWGDTIGYTNTMSETAPTWISVADGKTTICFEYSDTTRLTYGKDVATLKSEGLADDNGNLIASNDATKNRDAARAHWGSSWRMMTDAELQKLVDKNVCTSVWTTVNGVYGHKVFGITEGFKDRSIFLPAAGQGNLSKLYYADSAGYYFTSSPNSSQTARQLRTNSTKFQRNGGQRYYACPVRPVCDTPPTPAVTPEEVVEEPVTPEEPVEDPEPEVTPEEPEPEVTPEEPVEEPAAETEYVQLWKDGPYFAKCNVGATKPEDAGYYFCWGDTVGYKRNAENTAWVSSKDGTTTISFGNTAPANSTYLKSSAQLQEMGFIDDKANPILNAEHDAATVNWGAPWRMATYEEYKKLADTTCCTSTWVENWNGTGVKGFVVTGATAGYTDKSIFLPVSGYGKDSDLSNAYASIDRAFACYWASTHAQSAFSYVSTCIMAGCNSYFALSNANITFRAGCLFGYNGGSVRPVCDTPPTKPVTPAEPEEPVTPEEPVEEPEPEVTPEEPVEEPVEEPATEAADCVQLWKDGPYFAKSNIGATEPQESGYFFWWGDTVGYTNHVYKSGMTTQKKWVSVADGSTIKFVDNGTAAQTYVEYTTLQSEGWTDEVTGNLASSHDAATAHLGAQWRMPTGDEMQKLTDSSYCTSAWVEDWNGTGVNGFLLTGVQEGYADKSIFLPATGAGLGNSLNYVGDSFLYRSSTPDWDGEKVGGYTVCLSGVSGEDEVEMTITATYYGYPIRPVCDTPPTPKATTVIVRPNAKDNTFVAQVTGTGTIIAPVEGDYTVAKGANVEVVFQADAGYYFEDAAAEFGYTTVVTNTFVASDDLTEITGPAPVAGIQVGDSAYAVVKDGVCTLVGTGATWSDKRIGDFVDRNAVTKLVIADGVTEITQRFFKECYKLGAVTGGKDLVSIGKNAFYLCMRLKTINLDCTSIPAGLDEAVVYCTAIDSNSGAGYTIPAITVANHQRMLRGKKTLTDAEWTDLGSPEGQNLFETGYNFFKIDLVEIAADVNGSEDAADRPDSKGADILDE